MKIYLIREPDDELGSIAEAITALKPVGAHTFFVCNADDADWETVLGAGSANVLISMERLNALIKRASVRVKYSNL